MKTFFLLCLLLIVPALVSARIGETSEQCEARYGKPVDLAPGSSLHEKAGLKVLCTYHEGKCDCIAFFQIELNAAGKLLPFSDVTIETLLKANSGGETWRKITPEVDNGMEYWLSSSMQAGYHCDESQCMLRITTHAHDLREKVKEKAAAKGRP